LSSDKVVVLTDGTCGSTCAAFTKIAQEANLATFVGLGGLWGEGMDVSSFAGGFVCNVDILTNMAKKIGEGFPQFVTNQRWQFDWAVWYSQRFPGRPAQFTEQQPDFRVPFWDFPSTTGAPSLFLSSCSLSSSIFSRRDGHNRGCLQAL
jgi:hypothetical protein